MFISAAVSSSMGMTLWSLIIRLMRLLLLWWFPTAKQQQNCVIYHQLIINSWPHGYPLQQCSSGLGVFYDINSLPNLGPKSFPGFNHTPYYVQPPGPEENFPSYTSLTTTSQSPGQYCTNSTFKTILASISLHIIVDHISDSITRPSDIWPRKSLPPGPEVVHVVIFYIV